MTYALVLIVLGNVFVLDHGLTRQDCELEAAATGFACVQEAEL